MVEMVEQLQLAGTLYCRNGGNGGTVPASWHPPPPSENVGNGENGGNDGRQVGFVANVFHILSSFHP